MAFYIFNPAFAVRHFAFERIYARESRVRVRASHKENSRDQQDEREPFISFFVYGQGGARRADRCSREQRRQLRGEEIAESDTRYI